MKRSLISASLLFWSVLGCALLFGTLLRAGAGDLKIEAQLLWGTDDSTSPNPKHKPVDTDTRDKLKRLPLKWANYFEVTRKSFDLPRGSVRKVSLSDACEVEVKSLEGNKIEVTHFGKGRKVATQTQTLPRGELFVLGGNAPNATAWLVVLKRLE